MQKPRHDKAPRPVRNARGGPRLPASFAPAPLTVAAVVATYNRPQLLARRSLRSIAGQTRPPDLLIVVDDSDPDFLGRNKGAVDEFRASAGVRTLYLKNARTRGAAGAWNTALAHLYAAAPSAFVAILDDDDSWDPEYLCRCERAASRRDLDMVAAGITYRRSDQGDGMPLDPPGQLAADDLLVRNTNIQGSNMFVRLRRLLEAGGFDEAMASTTDRDICIRLADLGTVRYGTLPEHLVCHYAEDCRPRMSTAGSAIKRAGLEYFFSKYRGRMSEVQKSAFIERCRDLFGCDPSVETLAGPPAAAPPAAPPAANGSLDLVVGAITSPDVSLVANLMASLASKFAGRAGVALKVVLLENGGPDAGSRNELRAAVEEGASSMGLDVTLKTLEQQISDAAAETFLAAGGQGDGQKSIAMSRTMLQHYLYLEASKRASAVVLILDDDLTLDCLEYGSDCRPGVVDDVDYVSSILRLRETGADAVLCRETGDSPVPAPACVRTQMVDLYHNLLRMANLHPDEPYPDLCCENMSSRLSRRDYYYDLSSMETDRLERPFWYEARRGMPSTGEAFCEMVSRLPDIFGGVQVFRPLVRHACGGRTDAVVPSISRGPATLVFDIGALRDFPNAAPAVGGAEVRRSDMVWSLLNHFAGGRTIVQSELPVRHVRKAAAGPRHGSERLLRDILGAESDPGSDHVLRAPSKMLQDMRGHALYSALQDIFEDRALLLRRREGREPHGMDFLHLAKGETERAVESYGKHLRERALAFETSFVRIMGLLDSIRRLCRRGPDHGRPWWLESPKYAEALAELQKFVDSMDSVYTDAQLDEFRRQAGNTDTAAVRKFLRSLPETADRYRSRTPLPADALRRDAAAYVRSEFATGPLDLLGMGDEGVVLTDGRLSYKHFHHWNFRGREDRADFLESLAGRMSEFRTLPDIVEVRRKDGHVVAVYQYESGTRYEGGHLDGLLELLRECRRARIACRNIHPDNLLVTSSGLRLVDCGADIVPLSDGEFEQMCRRAFLTYRFPLHSGLRRMMTRALGDAGAAELAGLEHFKNALDPRGLDELFYGPLAQLIVSGRPRSVLDYGCGSGRLAERLARDRIRTVQYDPDPSSIEKCRGRVEGAECGGAELLKRLVSGSVRFDTVVCSRVLCTIASDSEFGAVLRDLRRLVSDTGTVFVAVCNPFHLGTASTELSERLPPKDCRYKDTFPYHKIPTGSGNRRIDVHRSYATYVRAFAGAGLDVREALEFGLTDTRRILPAAEHLIFRLSPAPAPSGPSVSLLIKTCLMEWRTVERLVRHHVGQLQGPRPFAERVVVVDPSDGPFLRQYDRPDYRAHAAAMGRLLLDGVVDRVVYARTDPQGVRATYRKWFGAESDDARAANGQQLFASLFGFDACTGDYVLQLDSDLLIARADRHHDYLADMMDILRRDPAALFVSMCICGSKASPYTAGGSDGDWRVEVRGCMYDRRRLASVLPVRNPVEDGRFGLAWHRAFDLHIASGPYRSYRGGDPRTAMIHVPNGRKTAVDEWMGVMEAVERGHVPQAQLGRVDLAGSRTDWSGPRRSEPYVFVVCGSDVPPGQLKQCLGSMASQQGVRWGAVVVDDASANGLGDYAGVLLSEYADRVTIIRNERRRGGLYSTWNAITRFCCNPETVVVILDAGDALIGGRVLERVQAEYDDGADATVGSMLRLDGEPLHPADFENPRSRGGNVWQPPCTFKKRLFDAIDVADLKIDGEWISSSSSAAAWAFMVPIIEMASDPRHVPDWLYLHWPAAPRGRAGRLGEEQVIRRVLSRQPYSKL